jgi:hypothetical protein
MADFNYITERLVCGAQINGADDMQTIINAGITHIIDAQIERNDLPFIVPAVKAYCWDPTADDGQPKSADWFEKAIAFAMDALYSPGNVVMCHCAAGVNRGPSLAYAILRVQGESADEAWAQLKFKRPQVGIRYAPDAELALKALGWTK